MVSHIKRPQVEATILAQLKAQGVPLSSASSECQDDACQEDCDFSYGRATDKEIDQESKLLGTVNAYARLVVCSTGASDWTRDVMDDQSSLAFTIEAQYSKQLKALPERIRRPAKPRAGSSFMQKLGLSKAAEEERSGVHPSLVRESDGDEALPSNVTILNGSHLSTPSSQSVLIFPDYKIITRVKNEPEPVADLVQRHLVSTTRRTGQLDPASHERSQPLPYLVTMLVCSHKRRDKKCSIAAPLLIDKIKEECSHEGWEVDEHLDEIDEKPIEDYAIDAEQTGAAVENRLREISEDTRHARVAVVKCSHIGGHRYAGNVILAFPQGTMVWYGRVTPGDIKQIFEQTIKNGKIIPDLLRGGIGITRAPGCVKGLNEW
ncbi:uncharacterized protein L969DRAFT_199839 [Mixia osmundae IAM 14324]|uniref:Sucraseferredoxin-like protein n=1 Tax=Mixia osmundae (strain CBS 9802 / IAM 14324 / JCM 22182 / KY 12970) TaxID=764103 RepID=G7DWM7_MIXOS|nr:uncharacterized protein L969DRAFT_199839 [Mixia osmundae IAM 14324]KEI37388.1 hypothetical protein L969DRAFT_199839 [Mixia osmundae IAM 14324]GAA94987.1 hypothetical protein E5Q_01642 [Mixia osmundae IAM 14324]